MGVDSRAFYPNVDKVDVEKFIKLIAKNVSLEDSNVNEEYKILNFEYRGESRHLSLHSKYLKKSDYIKSVISRYDISSEKAEEWWEENEKPGVKQDNLPIGKNGTLASLRYWGSSVDLLNMVAYYFGGHVDESDSDSTPYHKVDRDYREIIKIVFKE